MRERELEGLWVRDVGEGAPVVLLHPGPGLDGSVFFPGAWRLAAAGHRVIALDLPGNGRSRRAEDGELTLSGLAAAVQRVIEALELRDWTLLGHSFGGYVALQHLADFPGAASRLVASCTEAEDEPPPGVGIAEPPPDVKAAFEREDSVRTPEECREVWRTALSWFSPNAERAAAMLDNVVFVPEMHRARDWGPLHTLGALAASDIPVLSICGERDPLWPPPVAQRIADTAPRGVLMRFEDAGHFPFAEDPRGYWGTLAGWLAVTAP